MFWPTLVEEQKLAMHKQHYYAQEILPLGKVSHVRLNIFPDGGVSRLRLWGKLK
jgi:allantoicase